MLLLLVLICPLLLSMLLLLGFGLLMLVLLLFGMVLLLVLLLVLRVSRSDSEKQRQNSCAGDSNKFHRCYLRCCWVATLAYCKLPVVALTGLPMASPDTRSSTLRFCCRPAELSLEATGRVFPKPFALTELVVTPCCTK